MINLTQFKSGYYPFPDDDVPRSTKDTKEWHKKWCEAIYSAWMSGKTGIGHSDVKRMKELRDYGAGKQDPGKYMDILLDKEKSEDGARKGWINVNWDILSVAPKFKAVVMGIMEQQDHQIIATAIDQFSNAEKEAGYWNTWFQAKYHQGLEKIKKQLGITSTGTQFIPESLEELDLFNDMGGFKLKKETAIEKGLDYSFYISDWKQIKRKIFEDFLDINIACTKDYVDPYTNKVRCRYVNPISAISQYSKSWDFNNAEYAGEIIRVNIKTLRRETGLSEEKIRAVAYHYNAMGGNPDIAIWDDNLDMGNGVYRYDNFWVDVLDAEWFSVDKEYKTKRTKENGEVITYKEKYGKVYDTAERKTTINVIHYVRRAKLVLGTDIVYDYGLQYDIPRKGKKECMLSFHWYKLPGRSLIDLGTNNFDNLQLAWLKFQNNLAMSAAPGLAVEWASLQNMTLKGKKGKMSPLDILTIRRDTGDLVYRATTHRGHVNSPHAGKPVQELEGGMGRSLEEFITIFNMNLQMIRDITGINRIADASDPNPEQSVGGSQMAVAATANALRPLYSGYINIKENTALNIAIRMQLVIKHSKEAYEVYLPVFGTGTLKLFQIGTEVLDADWSIKIEAKPTEAMKDKIRMAALESMKPDRDGYIGLEWPDYMLIERMLESGQIKFAEALISHRSRKNKERQDRRQKENMAIDAKNAQETARVKGEEERKKKKEEWDLKKDFETHSEEEKRKTETHKHNLKLEEMALEKGLDQRNNPPGGKEQPAEVAK